MIEARDILFMGIGRSTVLWYRCALPALHLGADWVGVRGEPPGVQVVTGLVRGNTSLPRYDDYRVVIVQQPYGRQWLKQIRSLQERGIKVLYEIDDYLHGVAKQRHHDFARHFTKQRLAGHEMCMRVCDGLIASTEYIGRRYRKFNRNVYICRNGIDIARYALTRPERPTVNIGWAGATGHAEAVLPWINAIVPIMRHVEHTCLVTIGQPGIAQGVGRLIEAPERAIGIPFAPLECYPAAMCMVDIALAPAGNTGWYHGKSDLRWLEASALGIPTVADEHVYHEIDDGRTGFAVDSPEDAAECVELLVHDADERKRIGENARDHVERNRTSDIAAAQWFEVCSAVAAGHESMYALRRSTTP